MEQNPVLTNQLMATVERNNVVQNILRIPLIEIEQLNPRIRQLNGAMDVRYHKMGGNSSDPEGSMSYEYDWVGGEIKFSPNPFPRVPIGTGRVAFLADDEGDPAGQAVQVPAGALSGELFGWNRELLASHYGECYWKIVDAKIDLEIRDRYRSILINKFMAGGLDEEGATIKADELVEEASKKQAEGAIGAVKVSVARSSISPLQPKQLPPRRSKSATDAENDKLRAELEELKRKMAEKEPEVEPVMVEVKKDKRSHHKKKSVAEEFDTVGNLGD